MNKIVENIKKYVYYTINTLIIIFAILAIYYMFQTTILKKQYANMFGYTAFRVATGSMESEINIGDVIVVKLTDKVNNNIRGSIRSRGPVINEIAADFGGGGHALASGVKLPSFERADELIEALDNACKLYKEEKKSDL